MAREAVITTGKSVLIWQDAIEKYEKTTGRSLADTNRFSTSLNSVDDLRNVIQRTDRNFSAFRNRHAIWGHLKAALKPLQFLGNLSKVIVEASPFAPAGTVLGAALHLLESADGVSATYDAIENVLRDIGETTKRVEVHSQTSIDPNLEEILTKIICVFLEILAHAEKLIRKRRIVEFMSTVFLGKDEKIKSLMSELQKLTDREVQMTVALINQSTQRIEKTSESISQSTGRIEVGLQESLETMLRIEGKITESRLESSEKEDKEALLGLLGAGQVHGRNLDLFESVNTSRMPESGDWLLEDPLFVKWKNQERSLLWIFGQPGRGKTFLSSRIIDYLQCGGAPENSFVGYFFVKEDTQDSTSVGNILKTVALQLAEKNTLFRKFLLNVGRESPEIFRRPAKFWKSVFLKFFADPNNITSAFIVVDGLDEAPRTERELLISLSHDLEQPQDYEQRPRVQLAVVGRPELQSDIVRCPEWEQFVDYIDVSTNRNSNDIQRFIRQEVDKVHIMRSRRLSQKDRRDLKKTIVQVLEEGANGMFQWVKLVLAEIMFKKTKSDVIHSIHTAPNNLLEMVGHSIERIIQDPDVPQEYFQEMLRWIACAKRPLTLGELQTVISTMFKPDGEDAETDSSSDIASSDSQDDQVEWDDWPDFETDLRTTFGSLVTLTRADGKTTEDLQAEFKGKVSERHQVEDEDSRHGDAEDSEDLMEDLPEYRSSKHTTTVQFSHASIRDFLFRKEGILTSYYRIDRDAANAKIIRRLLGYIVGDVVIDDRLHPYYFWSTENAMSHLEDILKSKKLEVEDQVRIVRLLYRILHVSPAAFTDLYWGCDTYIADNFEDFSRTLISVLNDWVSEEVQASLSEEERQWVSQARTSNSTLFEDALRELGTTWLKKWDGIAGYDLRRLIAFFDNCGVLEDDDSPAAIVSDSESRLPQYSPEACTKIARWFNFEEDGTWHARLGLALSAYRHYEAACFEYKRALELEPNDRRILMHAAEVYSFQDQVALAVETSQKALQIDTSDDENHTRYTLWQNIRDWKFKLGDIPGTVEAVRETLRYSNIPQFRPLKDFDILYKIGEYNLIMTMAKVLDEKPSSQAGGRTVLDNTLKQDQIGRITGIFGRVAETTGEIDWLDGVLQRVTSQCRSDNDIGCERVQRFNHALFLAINCKKRNRAIELLKELSTEYLSSPMAITGFYNVTEEDDEECSRQACYELLIRLYIQQALHTDASTEVTNNSSELPSFIETLMTRSVEKGVREYCSKAMATWYKVRGQSDQAREASREIILRYIDHFDTIETDSFYELASILLWAGDKENAAIAFAASLSSYAAPESLECLRAQQSTFPNFDPTPVKVLQSPFYCANIDCGQTKQPWNAYFICEYCCLFRFWYDGWHDATSGFCGDCAPLVKDSKLYAELCDHTHSFLQIYPFNTDVVLKAAYVSDDDNIRPRAEWLSSLKKEWTRP